VIEVSLYVFKLVLEFKNWQHDDGSEETLFQKQKNTQKINSQLGLIRFLIYVPSNPFICGY
jgi:hypothetical protein